MNSRDIPIDEMLADAGWLRALAGSLVADDATADEVAQDALIAAWRSPPKDDRPARAWLTTVVRNLTRKSHRSESRRRTREAAAARPEVDSLPGPDELLARLETVGRVGEHVAALGEPYRMTVILRFYEGLGSAEIARRLGVPAGTVRWRLKTALDSLRERMDGDHDGDRTVWVALLLPIAGPPSAGTPTPAAGTGAGAAAATVAGLGGILAVKKLIAVVLVFTLAAVGLHFAGIFDAPTRDTPEAAPEAPLPPPDLPPPAEDPGTVGITPPAAPLPHAGANEAVVRLRVLGQDDEAIADAVFRMSGPTEPVHGSVDGRVLLRYPLASEAESMRIEIRAEGFAPKTLRIGVRQGESVDLGVVRLERAGAIVGLVLGPDGRPVRGARIRAVRRRGMIEFGGGDPVTGPFGATGDASTGADGRFRIDGLTFGTWKVWAGAEGMRWSVSGAVTVAAETDAPNVTLTLEPLAPSEQFTGLVLDPTGKPVPRARVSFRLVAEDGAFLQSGTFDADEEGRFTILNRGGARANFAARDAEDRFGEARVEGYVPGSGEVVLRLTAARHLLVHAHTADGGPLAKFAVTLRDRGDLHSLAGRSGESGTADLIVPAKEFRVRIEAEGYRDEVRGPFTPDGAPAEISVEMTPLPGIRGRVTADGKPVAGARVVAHALADRRWHSEVNGFTVTLRREPRGEGVTDADGRFRLTPKRGERLLVRASLDGFAPTESVAFDYDPARGTADLSIALTRGGTLTGRVLGDAPSGTIVGISRGDTYGRTVRVGRDGKYRFEHLTPGPWLVVIRKEEILPGANSSFGGGRRKPIPFNCRVKEGETTVFDLDAPAPPAMLSGRLLVNGKSPEGWRAALHREGGGLAALTEKDLDAEGRFRLRTVEGNYRLIISSPGRLFTSTMVVVDLRVVGETRRELAYATGALEDAPDAEEGTQLLHRWRSQNGFLVLTPIPAKGGSIDVPTGAGSIVRFDLRRWSDPSAWPVVAEVVVR